MTRNYEVTDLNKALYVLLYDQYNMPDVTPGDFDETFIENIIYVLIQKNGSTCPFKNYSCEAMCKSHTEKCYNGLDIDCGKEETDVWRSFIESEEGESIG